MSRNGQKKRNVRAKVAQRNLARQVAKERKKVAVEVNKLQLLTQGDQNPHIQQLIKQYNQLLEGHNELVKAFNANHQVYSNSLQHLDARVGATRLVIDDLVAGLSKYAPDCLSELTRQSVDGAVALGGVHWLAYIKHYLDTVKKELEKAQQEASSAGSLITPEVEPNGDDVVFGGTEDTDVEVSTHGQARAAG